MICDVFSKSDPDFNRYRKEVREDLVQKHYNGEATTYIADVFDPPKRKSTKKLPVFHFKSSSEDSSSGSEEKVYGRKRPIGAATLAHHNSGFEGAENAGFVYNIAVTENARRKGIAAHLLDRITRDAEKHHETLITASGDPNALDLYRKKGFHDISEERVERLKQELPGFDYEPSPSEGAWTWLEKRLNPLTQEHATRQP